jgi:hypothetical protein
MINYTKTDLREMRSVIKAIATAKPNSLRRKNAERRAVIINKRLTKKENTLKQLNYECNSNRK